MRGISTFANAFPKRPPVVTTSYEMPSGLPGPVDHPALSASQLGFRTRFAGPFSNASNTLASPRRGRFTRIWSEGIALPSALFSSSGCAADAPPRPLRT